MKRMLSMGVGLAALALLANAAPAQSLGDYARQQRAQKPATPATKVYTNDNLPTSGALSEIGQPAPPPPEPLSPRAAAAAERKEKEAAETRQKEEKEWKARFAEQKKTVERLQRELDLSVREAKLRQLHNSADTSGQLYQPGQLSASEQQDQAQIAEKQQALDAAKQKLEDMKEELRKAQLPAEWAD